MVNEIITKSDILLTASDVVKWREEDKRLEEEIRERQQRRNDLRRKLDAAEIFAETPVDQPPNPEPAKSNVAESDVDAESAPVALCANLRKTGEALKVQQIRARLIELGFGEKLKAQPNYHYSLVYRLSKNGKLIKRGSKYRAPLIESPEGETGAVGAPAHH
jgi:hypothetical protein